ncbi:hypothetical protein A7U60_g3480 [Sanghuangporus baumii]|uniref:C2H2-type domain-containing protein n=1 Tax=Sanghuangporus baumii TaxID=108892 RepID=A0A9Q5ND47_SANBA|nr:hypothetical protein A7U60_g3480 [Sanghuangporus baumii]
MTSSPSSSQSLQFVEPGFDDDTKPRCSTCGKVFKRMYALERHLLVHDPKRSQYEHRCPYEGCKFSSLQKSNVKTHIAAVHEKVKHKCTLPCTAEDALNSASPYPERCGRVFSDIPALIRHEKRAHGYYRRGHPGRTRANSVKSLPQPIDVDRSTNREVASSPESSGDLRMDNAVETSPSDEKVQIWLDGTETRQAGNMDRDAEDMTPSASSFAHDESYNSRFNYPSISVSVPPSAPACTTSSISDAESVTTGSASSSISTCPSPVPQESAPLNQYYAPVSAYPQGYAHNYYYPYAPEAMQTYDASRTYSLHPAQFTPAQPQSTVYYETEHMNPPLEEWLPQLAEMKHAMQAGGLHNGPAEWDGTVTGLSLID